MQDWQPISIMFENQWITVEPKHYLFDLTGEGQYCLFLAMANSYNFALFGQPLFHGYYTHHHMENNFISYGPLKFGGSRDLYFGETPTVPMEKAGRMAFGTFVVLTGYLAALVFGYYYGAMP